jgi:5'-3' exoribonuclease 1
MNENGKIITHRLQVVLDEMQIWEQEIFEKEYGDMNWYKGKQTKHVKEMELARKKAGNGAWASLTCIRARCSRGHHAVLTAAQKEIFEKVQAFVLQYRSASAAAMRDAALAMPNTFPAGDRVFINKLADDLHLSLTWDEYDEQDQNLVTWRLPGALDEPLPEDGVDEDEEDEGEWEDEDEKESRAAVDRVLKKYAKAPVLQDDEEGDFDKRHDASVKAKMDEWKRGYYKVRSRLTGV